MGRADPPQGKTPEPCPQLAQLGLPGVVLWGRAQGVAEGHVPQAAQDVGSPLAPPLLRQERVQSPQEGKQL